MLLENCRLLQYTHLSINLCILVGYADDINWMGKSLRSVEEIFEALKMEGKEVGLKIN
jgi:hypothetical protein